MIRNREVVASSVRAHLGLGLLGLLAALGASACMFDSEEESDESVGQNVSALTQDYTDGSGLVRIRVTQCGWSTVGHNPTATCAVHPAYALVGGGAEVEGMVAGGGLLTESRPDLSLQTWIARSKDHVVSHIHRIRAYAVGMQLVGVSLSSLRSQIHLTTATSIGPANLAGVVVTMPAGEVMLGGGARTLYSGAGQLLQQSAPHLPGTWLAYSHDHQISDPGWIVGYLLSIPVRPSGFSRNLAGGMYIWNGPHGGGYQSSGISSLSPWAVTSVGAIAQKDVINGPNRFLTDAFPNMASPGGVTAWSKDHSLPSVGFTTAYALVVTAQ